MRKIGLYILLFIMFLLPVIVNAESCNTDKIKINSIELVDRSSTAKELKNADVSGNEVNIKVKMKVPGDKIKYKLVLKNESDEDLEFNKDLIHISGDYIDYKIEFEDDKNDIKSNSTKNVYFIVQYKNEVPEAKYQSGKYNDYGLLKFNISNEVTNNPYTKDVVLPFLLLFFISIILFVVLYMNNKNKQAIMVLIISFVIIPIKVDSLCKKDININTEVEIEKAVLSQFGYECNPTKFDFYEGMTFRDWINSSLYKGNVGGEYLSLEECKAVWGSQFACSLTRTEDVYSRTDYYTYYTVNEELQNDEEKENWTLLDHGYRGEYAYNDWESDTMEECTATDNEDEPRRCMKIGDKYYPIFVTDYYENEDDCNEDVNLYSYIGYHACVVEPKVYRYQVKSEPESKSLEECIEYSQDDGKCHFARKQNYYSPKNRDSSYPNGVDLWFYEDRFFIKLVGTKFISFHNLDDLIESKTYECEFGAECVSPESNILSKNNKTIKAKNIKENDDIAYYDFKDNKVKIGKVDKVYIHKNANNLIRYTFTDNTYLEATDYHPIYTKDGWKSYTGRNGYAKPKIGDSVKSSFGYKTIKKIQTYKGNEDYYDFKVITDDGKTVNNYFANGVLVEGSY